MKITLNLSVEEVNLVLVSLSKMPYEAVSALIPEIQNQAGPQVQQSEPVAPEPVATSSSK